MSFKYKVNLEGNIEKFIEEECNELGNFSSASEIVIEGLGKIHIEVYKK